MDERLRPVAEGRRQAPGREEKALLGPEAAGSGAPKGAGSVPAPPAGRPFDQCASGVTTARPLISPASSLR